MKTVFHSLISAFAAYSRIPVPQVRPHSGSAGFQICFFPLVGVVTGLLWCAAGMAIVHFGITPCAGGALLTAIPVIITGGIHMDGFLDTSDALGSWKGPEEALGILKDPHIGSFAVIQGAVYILLYFAAAAQLCASAEEKLAGTLAGRSYGVYLPFIMMAAVFTLSRELSGLSVLYFPKAKKDGMLKSSSDGAAPGAGKIVAAELIVTISGMIAAAFLTRRPGLVFLPAAAACVFTHYYRTAMRRFRGVTGDLAGWFLVRCELALLVCLAVAGSI